jgi:hypothetical protein
MRGRLDLTTVFARSLRRISRGRADPSAFVLPPIKELPPEALSKNRILRVLISLHGLNSIFMHTTILVFRIGPKIEGNHGKYAGVFTH